MRLSNAKAWLKETLGDYQSFLRFATVFLGVAAFFKGVRFPNLWAATQMQLDYRYGFVKRGLVGQLFAQPMGLNHYRSFTVFSFVALALTLGLLLLFIKISGLARIGAGETLLLYFSSLAFTYLANLVGYIDILEMLLLLLLLFILNPWLRFAAALPVVCGAILMHESFLFLFLPVLLFSFFVDASAGRLSHSKTKILCGSLLIAALICTVIVGGGRPLTDAKATELYREVQSRVDFPVRYDFFNVMRRSSFQNMKIMLEHYLHDTSYRVEQVSATIAFAPVIVLLLYFGHRMCKASGKPTLEKWGTAALVCAAGGPLLMHGLAWDQARWDAMSCLSLFLALALLSRSVTVPKFSISPAVMHLVFLVAALNMATGEALLDRQVKPYPFVKSAREFFLYLRHDRWNPPYPRDN